MAIYTLGRRNAEDRLNVFDSFRVDKNLPKHKDVPEPPKSNLIQYSENSSAVIFTSGEEMGDESDFWVDVRGKRTRKPRWWQFWKRWERSPLKVFRLVFDNAQQVEAFQERHAKYDAMIKEAQVRSDPAG